MNLVAKLNGHLQIMLPVLEKLLVLQDRDVRLGQLKIEAQRIPAEIVAVDVRVQQESHRLEALRQAVKHVEADRKKLEIDADSKRAQILKYRGQLTQIKSNTEYQALLKEINNLEREITAIEDGELEFMEKAEQVQPEMQKEQALLKELTAKVEADKAALKKRLTLIEEELAKLQADRQSLTTQVDADALSRYERLMRSKGDSAVVAVRNGNCGGCHLHIPAQQVYNARYGEQLTSCDYCGRILYYPGD